MAVIIKGKSITCGKYTHDHYLRGIENDRISLREIFGLATKDPDEALRLIEVSAIGTKCKKPLYSAKINPETDRLWTKDEIRRAVELLAENLGLKDHPRVVIEHKKKNRIHYHVLWSRFPPDGNHAVRMSNDYAIHQKTQKQLQKEFKLRPIMSRGRDLRQWEIEWAKRYGFDIFELRKQITKDFKQAKTGQEFLSCLESKGCILCQGDKKQFVLILPWSQHKALSSMIHGRPTKATLRRAFADIDISKLPDVQSGKAQVKARLPKAIKRRQTKTPVYKRPSSTQPEILPFVLLLSSLFLKAAIETTQNQNPQPLRPTQTSAKKRKNDWPEQAIADWEMWGHLQVANFFYKWPELKPSGLELPPPKPE